MKYKWGGIVNEKNECNKKILLFEGLIYSFVQMLHI